MELVEVDAVGAEPAQAAFHCLLDRRRAGTFRQARAVAHAELGGDDDLVATAAEGGTEHSSLRPPP